MNTIFGTKMKQTQGFLENGRRVPLTFIQALDAVVTDVKTTEKHGYAALQVGLGQRKKANKALLGHVKKANLTQVPFLMKEIRVEDSTLQAGETIKPEDVLKVGDIIDATGMSKGKGFAGGVKRYHFRGGPRTHGQSDRERAPGSIGQGTTPGRVYKGKKMAGNMGHETVTVKNLIVVDVDSHTKVIAVSGLVPGILKSMIELTKVGEVKEKNFVPLLKDKEEVAVEEIIAVEEAQVVEEAPVVAEMQASEEKVEEAPVVEEVSDSEVKEEK
jgi:large subunit ribosomal protein L3